MPYIKKDLRWKFGNINIAEADNAGELNYLLTTLALRYIEAHGEKYQTYNDVLGVLDAMKQELYRRSIAPYEDKKIVENGDVYN